MKSINTDIWGRFMDSIHSVHAVRLPRKPARPDEKELLRAKAMRAALRILFRKHLDEHPIRKASGGQKGRYARAFHRHTIAFELDAAAECAARVGVPADELNNLAMLMTP